MEWRTRRCFYNNMEWLIQKKELKECISFLKTANTLNEIQQFLHKKFQQAFSFLKNYCAVAYRLGSRYFSQYSFNHQKLLYRFWRRRSQCASFFLCRYYKAKPCRHIGCSNGNLWRGKFIFTLINSDGLFRLLRWPCFFSFHYWQPREK